MYYIAIAPYLITSTTYPQVDARPYPSYSAIFLHTNYVEDVRKIMRVSEEDTLTCLLLSLA